MKVYLLLLLLALPVIPVVSSNVHYVGPSLVGNQVGPLPSSTPVTVTVLLMPRNISGLIMAAQEVSNHQISPLSMTQIRDYFSPPQSKVMAVKSLFHSLGMNITYVSPDGFMVSAVAPASLIESTFHVKLAVYNNSGDIYYAPMSLPSLPSSLNGLIIAGLTNFTQVHKNLIVLGDLSNHTLVSTQQIPSVLSAIYYDPQDLQGAYNVTPIISPNEKNVTIAVIEAYGDPNIQSDVATFDKDFNLPPANITVIPTGYYQPYQGLLTGWDVETALDVEAAHSLAPYAHIDVVVAPSATSNDLFQAIDYVVSQKLADVVSMSWGLPENLFGTSGFYTTAQGKEFNYMYANFYFALGTAEGITFLASSGDYGASGGTPTTYGGALFPASSPFVTSVGGTSLYVNVTSGYLWALNSTATYGYETAWSVDPLYGQDVSTGGGPSTLFPGVVTPTVSADANPYTGLAIVAEGQLLAIGGTSLASPTWAGIMADLDSRLGPLGDVNDLLPQVRYALHNVTFGYNGLYGPGYGTTGLGTPNAGLLLQALSKLPKGLQVSVSTNSTWLMQGSTLSIYAYVTYDGSPVTSGNFQAYLSNFSGVVTSIPLKFNGTYWVGTYVIPSYTPGGNWRILVNGTHGQFSGYGSTYITVGSGMTIISVLPVQGPNALTKLAVTVYVNYPNGSPAGNQQLEAYLVQYGKTVARAFLSPSGDGQYRGFFPIFRPLDGTYLLFVNGSAASVYTYLYYGIGIQAALYVPVADALPSVSPGQNVMLIALPSSLANMSAYIYSPSGSLLSTVAMELTPSLIYEANYTIPPNTAPGFYTVEFVAVGNSSSPWEGNVGFYNLSFYISPSPLLTYVRSVSEAFQGQYVKVEANITYSNGTEVTEGAFSATLVPTELGYESLTVSESTSFPLQYNWSSKLWEGYYQLPSVLNPGAYQGAPPYSLAGPWNVLVSGSSPTGMAAYSNQTYIDVLPYTVVDKIDINGTHLTGQLVSGSQGHYSIYELYVSQFNVTHADVQIYDSYVGQLTAVNSTVYISGSHVQHMNLINSRVQVSNSIIGPSVVAINETNSNLTLTLTSFSGVRLAFHQSGGNVSYSLVNLNGANLSSLPPPTFQFYRHGSSIIVKVLGTGVRVVSVSLDGQPVQYTVNSDGGLTINLEANGVYGTNYLNVQVSDGVPYSHTFIFTVPPPSSPAFTPLTIISLVVAVVAVVLALRKR